MPGCKKKNQKFILKAHKLGKYLADTDGNIYCPRTVTKGNIHNGYYRVNLSINEEVISVYSHIIVWLTFNPKTYNEIDQVNHIDGNKLNNSINNLELVSQVQNAAHASSINLYRTKEKHPRWANCRIDSHEICYYRARGESVRKLAEMFQTSKSTISRIARAGGVKYVRRVK